MNKLTAHQLTSHQVRNWWLGASRVTTEYHAQPTIRFLEKKMFLKNEGGNWKYHIINQLYIRIYCSVMSYSCDPLDCSPPGSPVHEILQAGILGVGCHSLLQEIFPTQGSNLGLPYFRQIFLLSEPLGKPNTPIQNKKFKGKEEWR